MTVAGERLALGTSQSKDFLDLYRLRLHVGLTIASEALGQDALHAGDLSGDVSVGTQVVAKGEILTP